MIALIPARGGSKRIPSKNMKPFCGWPLLAWTMKAAKDADVFDEILVCTDDEATALCAKSYGIETYRRETSTDSETDFDWISTLQLNNFDEFAILRPTSPFRGAKCVKRAVTLWTEVSDKVDSIRAVRPVDQHPAKMWIRTECAMTSKLWIRTDGAMVPLLGWSHARWPDNLTPWHSSPTQALPPTYIQTGGLEIAWGVNLNRGTISGSVVRAFDVTDQEGFDINTPKDWILGEAMHQAGIWTLPAMTP